MRIALVGNWPPPYGGVSVHVAALARALRTRGHDVAVLDLGTGEHAAPGLRRARGPARLARALAGAAAENRLVHLHTNGANPRSWLVALAAGLARRPGAPRPLLTLHSGSAPAFLRAGAAQRALARAGCVGFGAVVAVNEEIARELARAGVERPVTVLPAFSAEMLERAVPPARLAPFRAAHAPLFAAALAPSPVYGAGALSAAFARLRRHLPTAGLVVFGAGTEGGEWNGPGLLGLGEISHGQAIAVLGEADVFVRPTMADGDALTVREALAHGCAVVASEVGHRPAACLTYPAGDGGALLARLVEAASRGKERVPAPAPGGFAALLGIYRSLWGAASDPRTALGAHFGDGTRRRP
jgi:glycosyltransferase involved in cell wall biosynthesis